jgi:uncharacterized phage protein (TIGR01671 family)
VREIKFRAWIDEEYMVFSDGTQTHPYDDDEIFWNIQGALEISTLNMKDEILGGEVEQYEAFQVRGGNGDEVFFMQFTGLQDKDGVDIYEGDLIKNESGRVCEVVFNEYCAAFDSEVKVDGGRGAEAYGFKNSLWKTHVTIIGNIHQNPELLEQVK